MPPRREEIDYARRHFLQVISVLSRELDKFDKSLGREVLLKRGRLFWELERKILIPKRPRRSGDERVAGNPRLLEEQTGL